MLLNYMDIAENTARIFSRCRRKQTGAVIALSYTWVSGYNNIKSCIDCDNCPREGKKHGDWTEKECPIIHAEIDVIERARKSKIDTTGTTMYSTYKPCISCAKAIVKAGIVKVIYRDDYPGNEVEEYFEKNGVELVRYERKSVKD